MTEPDRPIYGRMAVIGCGLIGSSVIRAARSHGAAAAIAIADADPATLARAEALGLGDAYSAEPAEAVTDADLVLFAVPVLAMGEAMAKAAPALKAGATITDVGSVKGAVAEALATRAPPDAFVIPGHPVAGT